MPAANLVRGRCSAERDKRHLRRSDSASFVSEHFSSSYSTSIGMPAALSFGHASDLRDRLSTRGKNFKIESTNEFRYIQNFANSLRIRNDSQYKKAACQQLRKILPTRPQYQPVAKDSALRS